MKVKTGELTGAASDLAASRASNHKGRDRAATGSLGIARQGNFGCAEGY